MPIRHGDYGTKLYRQWAKCIRHPGTPPEWVMYESFKAWAVTAGWQKGAIFKRAKGTKEYSVLNCYFCMDEKDAVAQYACASCGVHFYRPLSCGDACPVHGCGGHGEVVDKRASSKLAEANPSFRHGGHGTPLYQRWLSQRVRMRKTGNRIPDEWASFPGFKAWAISAGWVEGSHLSRGVKDGHQEPLGLCFTLPGEPALVYVCDVCGTRIYRPERVSPACPMPGCKGTGQRYTTKWQSGSENVSFLHGECGSDLHNSWRKLRDREKKAGRTWPDAWKAYLDFKAWAISAGWIKGARLFRGSGIADPLLSFCYVNDDAPGVKFACQHCQARYVRPRSSGEECPVCGGVGIPDRTDHSGASASYAGSQREGLHGGKALRGFQKKAKEAMRQFEDTGIAVWDIDYGIGGEHFQADFTRGW